MPPRPLQRSASICAFISFSASCFFGGYLTGRLESDYSAPLTTLDFPVVDFANNNDKYLWELNMRRARSYSGITVPLYNGYSAKCIPDVTMSQMNAKFGSKILIRSKSGLSDGLRHADDNLMSEGQVGKFAATNMKLSDDGRPIWTSEVWTSFQNDLNQGKDGGPPGYRNSGKSVRNGVVWALENILQSCGAVKNESCHMAVFSAISPWAESIMFWSASKLSRINLRITSVDFNPCILDENIPRSAIAECQSTLDLVNQRPDSSFDLTVSYSGIEHDGLGRYGDPVNPNGDISALREMWLLTKPGGVLLLAVPRADSKTQPRTDIPIWGNGKIQVLQHRSYGAERYVRLLIGWVLEGFVMNGKDVVKRELYETKMSTIARMLDCSFRYGEQQPLLILRKLEDTTFNDVLIEGGENWNADKVKQNEKDYLEATMQWNQNVTCH